MELTKDPLLRAMIVTGEEAVRENPKDVISRADLAMAYGWAGRATDAAREFETCLKIDPNNGQALARYGLFYCAQGNLRESISYLKKALGASLEPAEQVTTVGGLGAVCYMANDRTSAVAYWNLIDVPALEPMVGCHLNVCFGVAYLCEGRVEEAISRFKKADLLAGDKDSMATRFPGVVLGLDRKSLATWPHYPATREILDIIVPLAWGVNGPIMHRQMTERLIALILSLTRSSR